MGSPRCSDRVRTREGAHRGPAATAHAVRTPFVPESQAACRCTDRQGLHADKRSQNAVHCCLWRWRSEREMGACSLRLNRLARIFGKFLASGFFDEGTASEKSENRRINTGDLWWAWVDLNHRPRPYHGSVVRFYKNLQVPRGLPNTAQVIQGHSNCGFKCGLKTSALAGHSTAAGPWQSPPHRPRIDPYLVTDSRGD